MYSYQLHIPAAFSLGIKLQVLDE